MATFRSLAKRMRKIEKDIPIKVNRLAQQTANDILIVVTSAGVTKVDTSEAVSNWTIGVGSKDSGTRGPFVKGRAGSTAAASRAQVRAVGRIKILQKKPNQAIHISNSVEHLNEAFQGDVQRVIAIGRQKLAERLERFRI